MSAGIENAPAQEACAARRRSRIRRIVFAAVLLVAAAIVIPPYINVNRFRPRIAGALSRSLGRTVTIGDVSLRLFPTPGLNMARVVVDDNPAFSREPLLTADSVTATLRLTSLWRGRLEIASLSFDSPSLNLVRRPDGHWNLESLLERARQTPVAPTGQRTAGVRTRFPYIESNSGRVNLKLGDEKTVFALDNADFSLWLERENEWHLRLTAQPIRTTANLGDAGTIKLNGTVRRGNSLSETPLDLHFALNDAQLGQFSTLLYGRDRGWRGTLDATAELKGTPAALHVGASAAVDDFHRYDITTPGDVLLRTSCSGTMHSRTELLDNVQCSSRVGNGAVQARGAIIGVLPVRGYQFSITARDIPAGSIAALVRHMKKDLPEDVSASGALTAQLSLTADGGSPPQWSGAGAINDLTLRSSRMDQALQLGDVRFGVPAVRANGKHGGMVPPPHTVHVEPFGVDLGGPAPARAQAVFSRAGYQISLQGAAGLKRLLQVSQALGIAAPRFAPEGDAELNVSVAGEWAGFAQPLVVGSATVQATVPVNGIAAPLHINSAKLEMQPSGVSVQHLSFGWPKADVAFTGSIELPRHCTTVETCPATFHLHSDTLDLDALNLLLNPAAQKRPWYAFMRSRLVRNPVLARVTASGTLTADRLQARNVVARNVSAAVSLQSGLLEAKKVAASAFGGKLSGTLRADFGASPPQFETSGTLSGGSVSTLSGSAHPVWGTGKLNANFALKAAGLSVVQLLSTADGAIHYDWRGGSIEMALNARAPVQVREFRGVAELHNGSLRFQQSKLQTRDGIYAVSGTAGLDRTLELTLSRGDSPAFAITGTLEKPKVQPAPPAPPAQAKLQP